MNIYYKENTGIKTPQGRNCDFFVVGNFTYNSLKNTVEQIVNFWEVERDAIDMKPSNSVRAVIYTPATQKGVPDLIATALSWENKTTTSGDVITLKGAKQIN